MATTAPVWRVVVVEDDPATQEFFCASVRGNAALELQAVFANVADTLAWIGSTALAPDVLLTDLGLPDGSGLQIICAMTRAFPQCESLVISMFGDEDNVLASIEAGAVGYIHKDSTPDDIALSILEMKAGASPISPMIARRVLFKYRALQAGKPAAGGLVTSGGGASAPVPAAPPAMGGAGRPLLSGREQEVLELIARGFSYLEIARLQSVSVHTVQTHIKHLYSKLAVHSKNEAVFEATKLGYLP